MENEEKRLTWEEKIARIEKAPKEVQIMVAKAFIRDDIPDEDVQYEFNSETPEEMNDPEEHTEIENLNAEEPEDGIGAGFSMRVTKPSNNKNFITTSSGGWSTCIKGNPMDANANVLANCVGYASGRFNEIINIIRGTSGCTYKTLNCNAKNFKERAESAGLKTGSTPKVGAIMCWGNEGAGHVAIVERVDSNNQVYTSESGWGSSTAFWNQIRTNNNGRWGLSSYYYFRCFIYLPDDVQKIVDEGQPQPTPTPGNIKIGDEVIINGALYVSSNASSPSGSVSNKKTHVTRIASGAKHPYNTTGDLGWMDASSVTLVNNYPTGNYKTNGNMNVRTGAGTNYAIKKVKDLTADGKRNATSTNPEANAVYRAGTVFTAQQIINQNGVWAKTPSGYVCIQGASGTKYCTKL